MDWFGEIGFHLATDPHGQKLTFFCLFDPVLIPAGQANEQAKQASATLSCLCLWQKMEIL
jgi:hypothetical protein